VKKHLNFLWLAAIIVALPFSQQIAQAQEPAQALKNVYANYFLFGSILSQTTMNSQANKDLVLKEFNSITPENELKPENVMVKNGSTDTDIKVDLGKAAGILEFCEKNNISVRGHTLVWHSQTPDWFFRVGFNDGGALADTATMNKRMESYIKNVFNAIKTRYPNLRLYAYDVVNEAFTNNGGGLRRPNGDTGGDSKWTEIYGNDQFIQNAFKYARLYAPETCKLYYNDYNEYMTDKTKDIVDLVTKIKAQGNIDGIGMQSHLDLRGGNDAFPDVNTYSAALKKFKETGLDIQVTELDVTMNGNSSDYLEKQAAYYKNIMKSIIDNGGNAVKAVVIWGVRDNESWHNNQYPLLWTGNGETFTTKPAYDTLVSLIPKSQWGDGSNPGIPEGSYRLTTRPSPYEGGSVTKDPDDPYYSSGSIVTLTASPAEGWNFAGWDGDISCNSSKSLEVVMDKNKDITAKFTPVIDLNKNLVANGDFTSKDNWDLNIGTDYGYSNADFSTSGNKATINVTQIGSNPWEPQLVQNNITLVQGMNYKITFKASASANRKIGLIIQKNGGGYDTYFEEKEVELTTASQPFEYVFKMNYTSDEGGRIGFQLGQATGTVTLSDVALNYVEDTSDEPSVVPCPDPTPIQRNRPALTASNAPATYYSLKGEPLGKTKPQKAGVYIVKQGYSVKKVVVR